MYPLYFQQLLLNSYFRGLYLTVQARWVLFGCRSTLEEGIVPWSLVSIAYSEIVDDTSDQALGRFTTTLLSEGIVDLWAATALLCGMGDTIGDFLPCSFAVSCPSTATGGSLK